MPSLVNQTRPRVGVISIHPAPYRDPTFAAVHQRGVIDLQVITMFDHDAGHRYWKLGVPPYPNLFLGKDYRLGPATAFHPQILAVLRQFKFDVLVIPGYSHITSQLAILYAIATRTPFIYNADSVLFPARRTFKNSLRDQLVRWILHRAAAVWVPGKASFDFMRHHGKLENQIFLGSYCLDALFLADSIESNQKQREAIRAGLGIHPDQFVFLFAGRMIPERGLMYLMEAFYQACLTNPSIFLLLIGVGPDRSQIEHFMREHQITNARILNPVPIEQIGSFYKASDAYVLASINETYSLALAHAAILSLPMITTDRVGAVPDYVIDGTTGYLVGAGDSASFAQAMLRLATDHEQSRMMGQRAHQIAMKRTTTWAAEQLESAVQKSWVK